MPEATDETATGAAAESDTTPFAESSDSTTEANLDSEPKPEAATSAELPSADAPSADPQSDEE